MPDTKGGPTTPSPTAPAPMTPDQYQQQIDIMTKQNQVAQQQIAAANAQANAGPKAPDFTGLTGPDGKLLPQFALSDGSGYKDIATKANADNTANAMNSANQANMGQQANARTALATKGGLSGGAALRIAETGAQNSANAQQDVQNQSNKNLNDITGKTYDIGRQAETANVGSLIANQSGLNQYNIARYGDQIKAWAANKSADAQANAANSGGKKGK